MALQVWLPLNDDSINNNGVSGATITNHNAIINDNGKIGKCYNFSTNDTYIDINYNIPQFNNSNNYSISCWIKPTNNGSQNGIIGTESYSWTLYYDAQKIGFVHWISGGSTRTIDLKSSTQISTSVWTHVCITWDGIKMILYLNGIKDCEFVRVNNANQVTSQIIHLGGHIYTWSGNHFEGYINDVRIYDNCLSAKEVKEISKGLILHLPLTSYFDKNSLQYDTNIYTEADGSQWVRIFHHNNPNVNTARFSKTSDLWDKGYKLSDDAWCDIDRLCKQFTKFEFMCKQKTTSSAAETVYRWQQSISPLYATYAQIAPNKVTRITTAGYTNGGMGGLWKINGDSTRFCIANSSASNWYGAAGAFVVYSSGIPGYPNTTITTGYLDLYIKISDYPDDKVYDTSGYCHNGNFVLTGVGRIENYTLTPRYKTACRIVNGNVSSNNTDLACINVPFALDYIDAFTVSWWQKKENSNTGGIFCTSNISVGSLPSDYTNTCLHQRDSGFDMKVQKSDGTWEVNTRIPTAGWDANANVWQHYVLTWDQANVKAYKNGVLVSTTAKPGVKAKDFDYLYIGLTGAGGVWRKIIGSFSDFRWYVTVLSAADVKELYETSMNIDSAGNISPRVLTT